MATINRSSIITNASNELNIQQGVNATPKEASNNIALVYNVNPKYTDVLRSTSKSTTGSGAIYTTPSDKDFYITYLQLSYRCDNTCDTTEISISGSMSGITRTIARFIRTGAGTADKDTLVINFPFPLKMDKNVAINHTSTFAAGNITFTSTIGGFILE